MYENKPSNLAPILLFVFARLDHTKRTIEALAANELALKSDLIIYSDAARSEEEKKSVNQVREFLNSVKGFRSITVVERNKNYGLARNIIEGVTDVCNRYGRVIVLEDDLVTSPHFLSFMNSALDKYETDQRVWHISGWNYPIESDGLGDAFFLRVMNCWGWATWAERWQYFEKNTKKLITEFDREMIRNFDLDNSGVFWSQVLMNQKGVINTWAIYWYATIFKNGGLCLNPAVSYIENIGHDGSGTHGSAASQVYSSELCQNSNPSFPNEVVESYLGVQRVLNFYKKIRLKFIQRIRLKISAIYRRMVLR